MKQFVLGVITATSVMALMAWGSEVDKARAMVDSYDAGYKAALNVDKPSMDLEMACVALWADKTGAMVYK